MRSKAFSRHHKKVKNHDLKVSSRFTVHYSRFIIQSTVHNSVHNSESTFQSTVHDSVHNYCQFIIQSTIHYSVHDSEYTFQSTVLYLVYDSNGPTSFLMQMHYLLHDSEPRIQSTIHYSVRGSNVASSVFTPRCSVKNTIKIFPVPYSVHD